jgi:nitrite reductase/ring-hydroxylating ferredoxin subunit
MAEERESASKEQVASIWPRYNEAVLGLRNYWYPVMPAGKLGGRPVQVKLCGEKIMLMRHRGRPYALHDRCPHRGVPLSAGRREFPGMITCAYHGWTYDLKTGELAAVLTDGPDSPICGKANVRVKPYPVEERAGLIWVYVGDEPPPPVEVDIPAELLAPNVVIGVLAELRRGNWRYAVENSVDEGHGKYLHRRALWSLFSQWPAWTKGVRMVPSEDGQYLMRIREQSIYEDVYPRVGRWPRRRWPWQSRARGPSSSLGVRLPCLVRVVMPGGWTDYEIFVPVDADRHLAIFLAARRASDPIDALLFRLRYRLHIQPIYYKLLNRAQDQWMIELMQIPPERLYRPDISVTAWRKWVQDKARSSRSATDVQDEGGGNGRLREAGPVGRPGAG